ncbi:MAG TPA: phage portal protein [Blastocatellia bacterium]|nr:phage portal protein [Blastocatellia bacterium]
MFGKITQFFKARASAMVATAEAIISLVPNYLANLRWSLNNRFLTLSRQGYAQSAIVYACVRCLSRGVSEAPLRIYRRPGGGQKTPVELADHPVRHIIARPNPMMTEFEFWEMVMIHLSIVGASWWVKQRDNAGRTKYLWPLRPDRMNPQYGAGDQPILSSQP